MITIIGADWCPACQRAKKTADDHRLAYKYITIPDGQKGWDMLETLTGARSIPQILYHFGGSKEFNEALNTIGKLDND